MNEPQDNVEEVDTKVGESKDPYFYLERNGFTSEKFKIEIRGLPKYYGVGEFKKFLNEKLQLNSNKIKPPRRGGNWCYACFRNEEDRKTAIEKINGITWKQSTLRAQVANPAPDPFLKRKLEENKEVAKKSKLDSNVDTKIDTLNPEDRIKNSTIPLWNMAYKDQLELKEKEMKNVLKHLGQEISKVNKDIGEWLIKQKEIHNGLPCELKNIAYADTIDGYRNKCEFTIGKDVAGERRMIGFRLSSYAAGSVAVGPIDNLAHIPQQMKSAVKILEIFIKKSELEVYDPVSQTGYWKQVTARITRLNHFMLIIGINPQNMNDDDKNKLKCQLKEFFELHEKETGVTSLYFQTIDKKSAGGEGGGSIEHISGSLYIEEVLLDMKFRISPEAFFQINTAGAEILYKTAIELAEPNKDTTVLDICCGTGTIGLCFSKYCDEVLGIEIVPNAIKNAKENAKENSVTNCEFFVGKAEDILQPVIQRATKSNIVAIVDPPRAGIHQKALLALRKAKKLNKLVYISCDPKAATKNLVDLARPNSKQYFGEPLVPVKAVPVDMFPYTRHCELIIYLERFSILKETKE